MTLLRAKVHAWNGMGHCGGAGLRFFVFLALQMATLSASIAREPPVAPVQPVIEAAFGITIVDPYRYMEDRRSSDRQTWLRGQSEFAQATLDAMPDRPKILRRSEELDQSNVAQPTALRRVVGGKLFYQRPDKGDLAALFVRDGPDGDERKLLELNALSPLDGRASGRRVLHFYEASRLGRFVALGIGSADRLSIHVVDVATGKEIGRAVEGAVHSRVRWLHDESAFLYVVSAARSKAASYTPRANAFGVRLHRPASNEADPVVLVVNRTGIAPKQTWDVTWHANERWIVLAVPASEPGNDMVLYAAPAPAASRAPRSWRRLGGFGQGTEVLGVYGEQVYMLLRGKISTTLLAYPLAGVNGAAVQPIHVFDAAVRVDAALAGDSLYLRMRDASIDTLQRLNLNLKNSSEKFEMVVPPVRGSLTIESADGTTDGLVIRIDQLTRDAGYFALSNDSTTLVELRVTAPYPYSAPPGLSIRTLSVPTSDGAAVDLTIIRDETAQGNRDRRPLVLSAFSPLEEPQSWSYRHHHMAWYEVGGVRAACHVRDSRVLMPRAGANANAWRDLVACAQYLIEIKEAAIGTLALYGGSGDFAAGRALVERPDLWTAVVVHSGIFNTLRIGPVNGGSNPRSPPQAGEFLARLASDATHHVQKGTRYPAVLLLAAENEAAESWHSFKFAAKLRAATASSSPVLLFNEGGTSAGGVVGRVPDESAAIAMAFFLQQMGLPYTGLQR